MYIDYWKANVLDSLLLTYSKDYGFANSARKRQCQNITTRWKKKPRRYWQLLEQQGIEPHEQTKKRFQQREVGLETVTPVIWYPFSTDLGVSTICGSVAKVVLPGPPPERPVPEDTAPVSTAPATPASAIPSPASPSPASPSPATTRQSTRSRSKSAREAASTAHPTSPERERDSPLKMSSKKKSTPAYADEEQPSGYPPDFDEKRCRKSKQVFVLI